MTELIPAAPALRVPLTLADPKPAVQSATIQGALATLLSAAATLILVLAGQVGAEAAGPAAVAAAGAVWSIWGRLRATQPIAGVLRTPG